MIADIVKSLKMTKILDLKKYEARINEIAPVKVKDGFLNEDANLYLNYLSVVLTALLDCPIDNDALLYHSVSELYARTYQKDFKHLQLFSNYQINLLRANNFIEYLRQCELATETRTYYDPYDRIIVSITRKGREFLDDVDKAMTENDNTLCESLLSKFKEILS